MPSTSELGGIYIVIAMVMFGLSLGFLYYAWCIGVAFLVCGVGLVLMGLGD